MSDKLWTGEALEKLLATIYGYINEESITSGGIVGSGKLDKKNINKIINTTSEYFSAFNSLLETYSGTNLFAAEFSLLNWEDSNAIVPKGILFIPGEHKLSTNFLLSFEYEINQLDLYKAREDLSHFCKHFTEIELSVKRPELDFNTGRAEGLLILNRFSNRFAQKCYGIILEQAWKRKITSTEYDKKKLDRIDVKADMVFNGDQIIDYSKIPPKSKIKKISVNPIYLKNKEGSFSFLKFAITPEAMKKIMISTLDFGNRLFLPLNESSINFIQKELLYLFLDYFQDMIKKFDKERSCHFLDSILKDEIEVYKDSLKFFNEKIKDYFKSGEKCSFEEHFKNISSLLKQVGKEQDLLQKMLEKFKIYLKETFQDDEDFDKKDYSAWEFKGEIDYFVEYGKLAIKNIAEGMPVYLSNLLEKELSEKYINTFLSEFLSEQDEPVKALATTYMKKFKNHVFNKINQKYLTKTIKNVEEEEIEYIIPKELDRYMENFMESKSLDLIDLIDFACNFIEPRIQVEEHAKIFKKVKKKLQSYPMEVEFVSDFLLRFNVFNFFIEEHEKELTFPGRADEFIATYFEFVKKRMNTELQWSDLIDEWMIQFGEENIERGKSIQEQLINFTTHILKKKESEIEKKSFIENIEKFYEGKDEIIDALLQLFKDIFKQSIEMEKTFPEFLLNSFSSHLKNQLKLKPKLPKQFLLQETEETFKEYIENLEIKIYSKLLVKPILLILSNKKYPELMYQIKFTYAGQKKERFRITVGSNYEDVKKKILFTG
ncbi:MAG: hypothetical protein ACTSVE_01565 [Candidatus Helarchaeota archaeon]